MSIKSNQPLKDLSLKLLEIFGLPFKNKLNRDELFRNPTTLLAMPAITTGSRYDDLVIIKRLIEAYQRTSNANEQRGNSMWQTFFDLRHVHLHKAFRNGTLDEVGTILRNPGESDLFYGFDNLAVSILPKFESSYVQKSHAITCLDLLVQFAEAIGAIPLNYPIRPRLTPPWTADAIIEIINKKLKTQLVFPNPYPSEHGLSTSHGIISYRVIQALYQAHRIAQILKNVETPRILEIGAGLGRTAYYARHFGIQDYTIVDLPFTTMSSGYFLGITLGEDQIQLSGERASDAKKRIKILSPEEFLTSNERYDLIINADGFTELDPDTAQNYWNHIQKTTSRFLSMNHEIQPFSIRSLIDKSDCSIEVDRFPYWMRKGYVEEIIRFK